MDNTIAPELWSEEWLQVILEDLLHYHLNLYITCYHHPVHTQADLAFPAFLEKFNFSAYFTSCLFVCLIISLQVRNVLRKQLCSTRIDRCANGSASFVAYK